MSENLNENVVTKTMEESNVFDGIENEIDCDTMPNSKVGGVIVGAALVLVGAVLYKKAVKPGISWVKEKWSNRKSKNTVEVVENDEIESE